MGMTLFAVGALVAPLLGELGRNWLARNALRQARPLAAAGVAVPSGAPRAGASATARRNPSRPLRVVRVAEPFHVPANAGRMVISGRMADVCAELDRMAAIETAAIRH